MKHAYMIFKDKDGKTISPKDLNELTAWEIEEKGIYVAEDEII